MTARASIQTREPMAAGPEHATWRFITDGAASGARNMALDRALLAGRAAGRSPATLRLYRWARPTLTLGRFQDAGAVDLELARVRGVDVARRPTGGRAVLHDDELTYAIVAATADGVPRGVVASYRYFARVLAQAFEVLGVPAVVAPQRRGRAGSAACYLATSQADLAVGALKVSGSAQVWEGDSVLQHGSFVVARDLELESELTGLDADDREALARETCTIADVTGRRPRDDEIALAVAGAFMSVLGVGLVAGSWTDGETAQARDLEERFRV